MGRVCLLQKNFFFPDIHFDVSYWAGSTCYGLMFTAEIHSPTLISGGLVYHRVLVRKQGVLFFCSYFPNIFAFDLTILSHLCV